MALKSGALDVTFLQVLDEEFKGEERDVMYAKCVTISKLWLLQSKAKGEDKREAQS